MLILKMSVVSNQPASRRARNQQDKAARIRRAAMALFRDKGFAATTTREVAKRARIAAGTLFLYVKSKEDLVDFVFSGEITRVVAEATATLPKEGDVVARLVHLFGRLFDFYATDPAISRVLVAGAILPEPDARSLPLTFDFLKTLGAVIAEAQAAGQLSAAAFPLELAMHVFTLYLAGVLTVINGYGSADDARRSLERALEIHFLGLRSPGPIEEQRRTS
jgi:AcrR family transcriptional regulator